MSQDIRDSSGKKIAVLQEHGDRVRIHTPSGACLGYYDSKSNTTYRSSGQKVGTGNQLMSLL
jgi:hypothetical protein